MAQVTHDKRATVSKLLRSITKKEAIVSNLLKSLTKNEQIARFFEWIAHFFAKKYRFTQKKDEEIPNPGPIWTGKNGFTNFFVFAKIE